MTISVWPLCRQTAERMGIHTALTVNILLSVANCSRSFKLVSHLSAVARVTATMVGRPTNTSSSITEVRYNATYVSHMPTSPIKRTQMLSELKIPINVPPNSLELQRSWNSRQLYNWLLCFWRMRDYRNIDHAGMLTEMYVSLVYIRTRGSIRPAEMCKCGMEMTTVMHGFVLSYKTILNLFKHKQIMEKVCRTEGGSCSIILLRYRIRWGENMEAFLQSIYHLSAPLRNNNNKNIYIF